MQNYNLRKRESIVYTEKDDFAQQKRKYKKKKIYYEVDAVYGSIHLSDGSKMYLIGWKGYTYKL